MNNNTRILIFFGSWFVLWASIQWGILLGFNPSLSFTLVDAIVTNSVIASIACALFYIAKNTQPTRRLLTNPIIILAACVFIAYHIERLLIFYILDNNEAYYQFFTGAMSLRLAFNFLMILSVAILSWMWNYKSTMHEDLQIQNDNEKLLREAELLNLRQQIQPHFLFNSLNSISALLGSKPELARKMIQELADFLRGTLKKDDHQLLTLEAELQHVQLYLNIETIRFGHRLQVETSIEEGAEQLLIPSLIIQPIVENAIKFGLYGTTENIVISVSCKKVNDMLVIEISNPFDAETYQASKGEGFGLMSIERRLYLLFMRNDLLKITNANNIFNVQIFIPQPVKEEKDESCSYR